ncbi:MAG: SAM-dependent methyltransferase [Thermoflavifilum sp.]|nr:SAM-dependent methyltransferase [Thermoflavifilum sp.]
MSKPIPVGTLYLIPTPLHETAFDSLSVETKPLLKQIPNFYVEKATTIRRFLKKWMPELPLETKVWIEIQKHGEIDLEPLRRWLSQGEEVGVMSEAGCPGIADPGQLLVAEAHRLGARVVPISGPSAVMLALMASGFNGQLFRFNGYLPIQARRRRQALLEGERRVWELGETQIFIETPYRNMTLLQACLHTLKPNTWLCVAAHLTAPDALIISSSIEHWKSLPVPDIHQKPAIWLIGQPAQ